MSNLERDSSYQRMYRNLGKPALCARAVAVGILAATVLCSIGCYRGPWLSAWTTGEPGAPPDVAEVYRAVLDAIFPRGSPGPALIVIRRETEPSIVEIDTTGKHVHRMPDAIIAPFQYRIPIVYEDSSTARELRIRGRLADSISVTLPPTDPRRYQGSWAPFIERYPGAWGRLILGRVGFTSRSRSARVEARFLGMTGESVYGHEIFRLAKTAAGWSVVARIPRADVIRPEPISGRATYGWVDSSNLPPPMRHPMRIRVRDSVSGAPIPSVAIQIKSYPLSRSGQMLLQLPPQSWGTRFTDSRGDLLLMTPPRGYAWFEAVCPPERDVAGAGLAYATLERDAGIDTVLTLRVRMASCAEYAPAMAAEAKRHREDVVRARKEAAARAVQGNFWGTLRDSRTGQPVPRAWLRVDERGGLGATDSVGRFWLWGFAPGKHKIIIYCSVRRQWPSKVAGTQAFDAPPKMKDTADIRVDLTKCEDVPVDTVKVRTRGVWSVGFEDGFFTPCVPFTQIKLGGYRDWSHSAYLTFAREGIDPPGGWPDIKPVNGYVKAFIDVDGDLIGPGSYGHLGIATYVLRVTRVRSARAATPTEAHQRVERHGVTGGNCS